MKLLQKLKICFIKTIYFNFKMLPIKQAVKFPIVFYNKTRFINLSGKIVINGAIKFNMINIGSYHSEMITPQYNIIDIKGKLTFNGPIYIGCGCLIRVERFGTIEFGNKNVIGANTKIFSEKNIKIGDNTRIGWEAQIFDTNFHYLKNIKNNTIHDKVSGISLGINNWVGNRSSIMKGTITPDYTIISSNSLCNRDYSKIIDKQCIIGGSPAKLINDGIIRIFDKEEEKQIERSIYKNEDKL